MSNQTEAERVRARFDALREAYEADRFPPLAERLRWLDALEEVLQRNVDDLALAISEDFGHRSVHDSKLGDLWLSLSQIRFVRSHLPSWIKPHRSAPLLVFRPAKARVAPQPLGVVGIIAPWNYPIMLAVAPLAGALAAGNRVMLKLSEHAPRTGELLAKLIRSVLPEDLVSVVLGGPDAGKAVSELPFDHLLYTGGTEIGKKIAEAAARNLVPVTLELGGKCPAILHEAFPVDKFAERIAQGKCYSAGQSCVAPDYVLVPHDRVSDVVDALRREVSERFPTLRDNPDYSSVAGMPRKQRLIELRDQAVAAGARAIEINPASESLDGTQKLPLTLLLDVPDGTDVMRQEIFGPLLPIVPYQGLDDAIAFVNARPRPLALYYFDYDSERIRKVLQRTVSGGVTVNDTLLHFLCDDLPRSAVGASGYGAYLGRRSFDLFSHNKSVLYQSRISGVGLFAPPYGPSVDWILRRVLRVG
jgi:acyl-CoA reductase-like NAD-dependent aldehyde dehydrogenase